MHLSGSVVVVAALVPFLVGFGCDERSARSSGRDEPNAGEPPTDAMPGATLPTVDAMPDLNGFQGDLSCRPAGKQPEWLHTDLPIALSACSRNLQIELPFVTYNSTMAGVDSGVGKGFHLNFEHSLELTTNGAIYRAGDLTERHFWKDGAGGFVPEPYFFAQLRFDPETDEYELLDLGSMSRTTFSKVDDGTRLAIARKRDADGVVMEFLRHPNGRLRAITTNVLASDATPWYRFQWTETAAGTRGQLVSIQDAADRAHRYDIRDGKLMSVTVPGDGRAYTLEYGNLHVRAFRLPGFTYPIQYEFDAMGRLIVTSGPNLTTRWEVTSDYRLDDSQEFVLQGSGGSFRARYAYAGIVEYVSHEDENGLRLWYERNDRGYLTKIRNADGRETTFTPDDARRPGSTTVMRVPMLPGSPTALVEQTTWGVYFAPVRVERTPGTITTFAYEGIDDAGVVDVDTAPWAFLKPRRITRGAETITVTRRTENAGTEAERRIAIYEHNQRPLLNYATESDRWGRLDELRRADGTTTRFGRDARGFENEITTQLADGSGQVVAAAHDPTGVLRTHASYPLSNPGRVLERSFEYAGADMRTQRYAFAPNRFSEVVDQTSLSPAGSPKETTTTVTTGDLRRTSTVMRELDAIDRIVHATATVPDRNVDQEGPRRLRGGRVQHDDL